MSITRRLRRGPSIVAWRCAAAGRFEGATLIDALIGLAVGLLAIVVAGRAFLGMDSARRNAAAVADLQSTAAFALYALASQVGNAGAGLAAASRWLETCPAVPDVATTLRPVGALIVDSGGADRPDSLIVRQSLAPMPGIPAAFAAAAPAGSNFRVESPDAFAVGDRVIAVTRTGACASAEITAVEASSGGIVDLAHSAVPVDLPVTTVLLNAGRASLASAARYDVASGALRSTDLGNGDAPAPLVSNVVNLKFLYGIDSDGDGALDTWVSAASSGAWSAAALLAAPRATLARIKAVRIGILVRSEQPDRDLTRAYRWVLFDCAAADKASCPGRLEGTIAASASGGYRYRTYETIVPLRNVLWNRDR